MVWKHLYTTALHTHLVSVVYATLFSATALPKKNLPLPCILPGGVVVVVVIHGGAGAG